MKRLLIAAAMLVAGGVAGAAERVSTMQPFEAGDIFVAATVMDVPDDDHAGTGRIMQFDADLKLKGVLWVEGTTHKIGALTITPDGVLWGFAPISWQVVEVGPDGRQLPLRPRQAGPVPGRSRPRELRPPWTLAAPRRRALPKAPFPW